MKSISTIPQLLHLQTQKHSSKPFLIFNHQSFTYAEIIKLTSNLSIYLKSKGIKKGHKVAIFLPNCPEFILVWFAIEKLGAIMVPINPIYQADEAKYILKHSQAKLVIVNSATKKVVSQIYPSKSRSAGRSGTKLKLISLTVKDIQKYSAKSTKPKPSDSEIDSNDIAAILYTSGTTGHPKGVLLPHRSYIVGGESFAMRANLKESDRMMVILPLFHVNAQVYSTIGCLVAGATLILRPKFSASSFWPNVVKYQVTQFNFLGVVANILLKNPPSTQEKNHHVRVAFGAGLSKETIQKFEKRFRIPLIETYGLTECPMGTSNLLADRQPGSIGKPSRHPNPKLFTQLKIVGPTDQPLPSGQTGQIILKSPALALGYYKNPKANKQAFKKGWFYTGDLGYQDSDGFVYFVDRQKDIIRKKGENISSKEIENTIQKLPQVKEVAVIPIPSALGDDDIKAYIVPKPNQTLTSSQITTHCSKYLNPQKVPSLIEFLPSLPKTPTQKIAKQKLKQLYQTQTKNFKPLAFIIDGIRTPIAKFFGGFRSTHPVSLLASCLNYLSQKYHLKNVDDVIIGCTNQSGEDSKNIARMSVLLSRLSPQTPATTVNRLSASSLEALRLASNSIASGQQSIIISGGVESFSRAPFILPRKNKTEPKTLNYAVDSQLNWRFLHPQLKSKLSSVGLAAESLNQRFPVSRQDQDQFAYNSNQKALKNRQFLKAEILPIGSLKQDQIPSPSLTLKRLSELPPLYKKTGTITAGNASKKGDAATALLLAAPEKVNQLSAKPLAAIIASSVIATNPNDYGIAPTLAINQLLNQVNLTLDHIGVIEIHEAYALQTLAVLKQLNLKPSRINRYGGAIALGHPFGATGARLVLTAAHQLQETQEQYGLIAICIGAGQAIATLIQKYNPKKLS